MRAQLTKRLVATAQPQDRPYELRDTQIRGLLLRVQPSGHKAFIIEWTRGKRRTLGALGHLTLDQARAHASQAMAEYIQQGLPSIAKSKPTSCTLGAFLTDHYGPWVTNELKCGDRYVQAISSAFKAFLSKQLVDIDAAAIEQWWTKQLTTNITRSGKPVTKVTLARLLSSLRSALSKAVDWKLLERNPCMGLRQKCVQSQRVVRFLSPTEEARLRTGLQARDTRMLTARASGHQWRVARGKPALPTIASGGYGDHVTPVVLLAMNTGLRRGELLSLCWSDIDLDARMITVRAEQAKNGRQRHMPINTEALAVLTQWERQSDGVGRVFTVRDIKTAWGALLDTARVTGFRFHDLRHHFASRLVTKGVDLNTVRELLGHADIKMTLRYAHLAPDHLAAAVAKLSI